MVLSHLKQFLIFLSKAILFYIIQIVLEVIVRLFLEYSGLMRSEDYSPTSLFSSTILYTGWLVIYTKLILSWIYLILFISFCYFLKKRFRYSLISMTACLGSGLLTFYYEDRPHVILSFYIPIIIASIMIIIGDFILHNRIIKKDK